MGSCGCIQSSLAHEVDGQPGRSGATWSKLGLTAEHPGDDALANDVLALMQRQHVDFTSCFRALASSLRGGTEGALFAGSAESWSWFDRWHQRLGIEGREPAEVAATTDAVNPVYISRNHLAEEALTAAPAGDLGPFEQLVEVLARPFGERPESDHSAGPAPPDFGRYCELLDRRIGTDRRATGCGCPWK